MQHLAIDQYKPIVADALKMARDGRLLELSTSPLAYTPLVESTFLTGVPASADVRGRALQSVLRWAANKLRPSGEHSWVAYSWRSYNTIYYFYLEGKRVAELAELMAIAEQTLYQARGEALEAVGQVIAAELADPQDVQARQHVAITDRYALFSAEQQKMLRLLATFQQAAPAQLVHTLAADAGVADVHQHLSPLIAAHWVVTNETATELLLHPDIGRVLRTLLQPMERRTWHRAIGEYYLGRHAYLAAARHMKAAGFEEDSAEILIANTQAIINDMQVEELVVLIDAFHRSDLSPDRWAQVKIAAGNAAMLLQDIETAVAQYQHALGAKDTAIKAQAYYQRAKALHYRNLDEALAHYAYCIRLLEGDDQDNKLLARVCISRALLLVEERKDVERARKDLERATAVMESDDRLEWSDLHTAWLSFYSAQSAWDEVIEHGQMAWLAANETQDATRMVRTAHNLGVTYARLGRYADAIPYLERSRDRAAETGNRPMEGLNEKTIGGGLFMIGDTENAVAHYLRAHQVFVEVGNQNWLAHTCFDLAEGYAKLGDIAGMRRYFDEGLALAQGSGDKALEAQFAEFAQAQEMLFTSLSARQVAALKHVQASGRITNKAYQQMNEVSARQALRDLQELEAAGLLVKAGKGRSTHYRLPAEA